MSSDLSAAGLFKSDPQLKNIKYDKYHTTASENSINKTKKSLEEKGHKVTVVSNKDEALATIKKLIPKGASVMNGGSTTLSEIGYIDYLKTQKEWRNIHGEILAETDPAKQDEKRRTLGMSADYFLSSVTAIAETGEITVCDLTGSRTGGFTYSAGNVLVVAGTNKIVPTYHDAVIRTEEYCLPIESARVRIAYKFPASAITNFLALKQSSPMSKNRIHVLLIKESLGY